jgi:hypothetical protein
MSTVYNYRVYCTTDSKYVTAWGTDAPTTCPENNTHTIDQSATIIINEVSSNVVSIAEETIPTNGYYKLEMIKMTINAGETKTKDLSFSYPINILSFFVSTDASNQGDIISWYVMPKTMVGVTTSAYTAKTTWSNLSLYTVGNTVWYKGTDDRYGSNYQCIQATTILHEPPSNTAYWTKQQCVLNVSPTVVANMCSGFLVHLSNGTTTNDCGYVRSIDKVANTITLDTASSSSYATGSYVLLTLAYMDQVEIGPPMNYTIGSAKIGSSHLPADRQITCTYQNKSSLTPKTLIIYLEHLY